MKQVPDEAADRRAGAARSSVDHNAEFVGLIAGALAGWEDEPEVGSPSWAVQEEILCRYGSRAGYESYFQELPDGSLDGHVSNLKGHAFERWLEHHGEMDAHPISNFAGSDGVDTETCRLIEAKAGSTDYIEVQRARYDSDIDMHTTSEGLGVSGVTAHDMSEEDFEGAVAKFAEDDGPLGEILGSSVAFGAVLSATTAWKEVRAGRIRMSDAPRAFTVNWAGKTARGLVIGAAVATGQPVLVATGAGWVAYKNRKAFTWLAGAIGDVVAHPTAKKVAAESVNPTAHHGWRVTRLAGEVLHAGATHPITKKVVAETGKATAKGAVWAVREGATASWSWTKMLGKWISRRRRV